jgi:hypothetical protein
MTRQPVRRWIQRKPIWMQMRRSAKFTPPVWERNEIRFVQGKPLREVMPLRFTYGTKRGEGGNSSTSSPQFCRREMSTELTYAGK